MENSDPNTEEWRLKFIEYYTANAPSKVRMVTPAMMSKWSGKYDSLMANLVKKYGVLGSPIEQPSPAATPRGGGGGGSGKKSISDFRDDFISLVSKATPTLAPRSPTLNVAAMKAAATANGLETSTFVVCSRVRPLLPHEVAMGGEAFAAVTPGPRTDTAGSDSVHTEELLLHVPKVSMMGVAKLETSRNEFDYAFGPDSTNAEIYDLACKPLVERCMNGQIGVMFAYGQTGSGKTHTMGGILDILSKSEIFSPKTDVTFSYIEMLGRDIKDCLGNAEKPVAIGEGLNGAVLIRNMSSHNVADAAQLNTFIVKAAATRATAATTKNDSSSRSHGVAILKVTDKKTKVEGTLYVIDLAGSESAKDSKDHDSNRMKETKEINSSLMALKECIRARTSAASKGELHVPYRRNKLTLLMKDVFDIGCSRLCSTVVIAACSPLASDISHTSGTIKYAAPLRVSVSANANSNKKMERDLMDPALWSNEKVVEWVGNNEAASGKINAEAFVSGLPGVKFCALPEPEFYTRAEAQLGDNEGMMEVAKSLYLGMWTLIVDAKTRKRRPDGSIITPEQEEAERKQLELDKIEKARVWAEREKHMKTDMG